MQPLGTKKITQPLWENYPKNSILVTNKLQEIGTGHLGLVDRNHHTDKHHIFSVKKKKIRTNNLHHRKAGSVAFIFNLRVGVQ